MPEVPRTADVVVVGGGVHGASVAYHLTRRGAGRVVLVERKFLASGPTGRSSALVRRFYAMDFLTRTANASADVFKHWSETIGGGDPGFRKVGVLWLAAPERAANLRGNVERARELGAHDRPQSTYMRPETGNLTIHGLVAYDEIVDPDRYNEGADPEEVLKNAELIARRFPVMEHGLSMGGYSGVYDVTPDHEPVLGPIPEYAGLFADFGWSGHGFKHSPAVGDIMAELVLEGRAPGRDLAP